MADREPDFKVGDEVHIVAKVVALLPGDMPDILPGLCVRIPVRVSCGGFQQTHVALRDCRPARADGAR